MRKLTEFYIDPAELKQSIIEMHELGHPTDRFARHLLTIQARVLHFPRFAGYPDSVKEELMSHNIYRWMKRGWRCIDPNKNPFAYITTACTRNFLTALKKYFGTINDEKKMLQEFAEEVLSNLPGGNRGFHYTDIYEDVSARDAEFRNQQEEYYGKGDDDAE